MNEIKLSYAFVCNVGFKGFLSSFNDEMIMIKKMGYNEPEMENSYFVIKEDAYRTPEMKVCTREEILEFYGINILEHE